MPRDELALNAKLQIAPTLKYPYPITGLLWKMRIYSGSLMSIDIFAAQLSGMPRLL
jgi:hypothetical protein